MYSLSFTVNLHMTASSTSGSLLDSLLVMYSFGSMVQIAYFVIVISYAFFSQLTFLTVNLLLYVMYVCGTSPLLCAQ